MEWNESEGAVKRTYHGLAKRSEGVVHFDTTKNRFLAAGDESMIKFWDMDSVNILTTTDAEGGLLVIVRYMPINLFLSAKILFRNQKGCGSDWCGFHIIHKWNSSRVNCRMRFVLECHRLIPVMHLHVR